MYFLYDILFVCFLCLTLKLSIILGVMFLSFRFSCLKYISMQLNKVNLIKCFFAQICDSGELKKPIKQHGSLDTTH